MPSKKLKQYSNHYLQSLEWRILRKQSGWSVHEIQTTDGTLYYYRRRTPLGGILYIPGTGDINSKTLLAITTHLRERTHGNIVCKIEPGVLYNEGFNLNLVKNGWKPAENIQYTHTVQLDLSTDENTLFMSTKKRARNEIRKAALNGVTVERVAPTKENFEIMYKMLEITSHNKAFSIRDRNFTFKLWSAFASSNKLRLYFAKHENDIVSAATVLTDDSHTKAWYKDGASNPKKAKLLGPRLMLWEVAKDLQKSGYKTLDLSGIPDPEKYMASHMKGIFVFKTAYSQETVAMMPAYELALKPLSAKLWPKIEASYRGIKRMRTRLVK